MTLITLPRSSYRAGAQGYAVGPSAAPLLVLVHGVGLALEAWTPQIESLSARYRVLALDMPGHGGSANLPNTAELGDYVRWLADILDGMGEGPVSVAGHSMGALISLGLAVERPDLLKRVALLNGVYRRDAAASQAVLARAQQISAGDTDPTAPLNRWFDPEQHSGSAYQVTAALLQQAQATGYATAYRAFAGGDCLYADRLHEVSCPLMALTGDGDANSTPGMAAAIVAGVSRGKAVVIAGHRHMLNLTAPDAVNAALHQWMEEDE